MVKATLRRDRSPNQEENEGILLETRYLHGIQSTRKPDRPVPQPSRPR